ncbi:hypothetical protein GGR58DRAFT_334068 [Xylaria digitata]|nr:hypothetical protein GGR58DRAFT_334068 [Xylaria digitata]
MRTVSLPGASHHAGTSEGPKSDIPSPLHIIKKTKTVEFRPREKRETSSGSIDYGPDRPLSVMKKRQHRGPVAETTFKTGDVMPKPGCLSPAQQQPKPRAPLRWLSRQRTSSSSTTHRRYDLRSYSRSSNESSIGPSLGSGFFEEAVTFEPSGSRSPAQTDTSFSSVPTSADYNDDCHLLTPRISITPEVQTSNNAIYTVWAAIEISAQLSRPYTNSMLNSHSDDSFLLLNPSRAGSVSRFGSLYNLQVDVVPTQQTTVIEVIQDDQQRSLNLGSTMLVLAKVQINHRQQQPDRATVQKSNELIADLESKLGAASIRYLQVRLRYHHSGFLTSSGAAPVGGIVDCQTQLETIATGFIEQQDLRSPSCKSPTSATRSSPFGLIASYWGPIRANEILFQKTSRQSKSMVLANTTPTGNRKTMTTEDSFTHQTEIDCNPLTTFPQSRVSIQTPPPDQGEDPAHKIWAEMRESTSQSRRSMRTSNVKDLSAVPAPSIPERALTNTGSMNMRSDVDRRRGLIRDIALRNKRSMDADNLRGMVPAMKNLDICGKEAWGDSLSNTFNKENVPPERRKEGRWSLASWW